MTTAQEFISQALATLNQTTANPRYRIGFNVETAGELLSAAYKAELRKRGSQDSLDDPTKSKIKSVANWMSSDTLKPSLLLCGGVGNGKTTMLRSIMAVNSLFNEFRGYRRLMVYSALEISALASEADVEAYSKTIEASYIGIDDLGQEPVSVKHYGSEINPVIEMICRRYEEQLPTIITTNLNMEKIQEVYGERVADRLKEMCEVLTYKTKSYRK